MAQQPDEKNGRDEKRSRWGIGSLRDALMAAGREHDKEAASLKEGARPSTIQSVPLEPQKAPLARLPASSAQEPPRAVTAMPAHAVAAASSMPAPLKPAAMAEPARAATKPAPAQIPVAKPAAGDNRTQLVRGRQKVTRTKFHQDPVVGWLVIIGGPGLGAYRPIFEGNNTLGRGPDQRIPIDFGDDTISSEEQAYVRYDSADRKFLFVPNLAKTNVVQINDKKPTGAVELAAMDVITMGRTQLVFVPFCGTDFDWSELTELKA